MDQILEIKDIEGVRSLVIFGEQGEVVYPMTLVKGLRVKHDPLVSCDVNIEADIEREANP